MRGDRAKAKAKFSPVTSKPEKVVPLPFIVPRFACVFTVFCFYTCCVSAYAYFKNAGITGVVLWNAVAGIWD